MKTEKHRILVVDDQISDTRVIKLYLERCHNYVVREENNPRAALAAAIEFKPDLILLDLKMPGMNGGEVAEGFAASPKLKAVPIVFLTGAVSKADVDAAGGRIGNFPFLAKPILLSEVVTCLKLHLGE